MPTTRAEEDRQFRHYWLRQFAMSRGGITIRQIEAVFEDSPHQYVALLPSFSGPFVSQPHPVSLTSDCREVIEPQRARNFRIAVLQ